ncbi:Anaphase-promoting complex subunit 7 [Mortierella sp. GBA43]|nr:Anaphase-promoting complex subunit 7 [Mortierella sp. GBA43]
MGSNNAEALNLFREAYRIDKDLITYEGLVNTYILMKSHMEALELAREAKRLMPDSAHALAIYGMAVYYLGDNGLKEALSVLQEALRMDPGCVEAATHLVTIYEAKGQHQEALEILDQQIDYQAVDKVYEKKAEIYTSLEQWEQALASYRNALSANPLNAKAKLGMAQVEKILSGGDEDEEDEAEASDHDERDMEAMDADPDQHGSVRGNMDASVQMGDSEYVDDFDHTPPPDSFIQSQLLEGDETFDRTPPPPPQQQRPPPTPQLPPRRIAPGTAVGSIISGSLAGPRLGSPTPGHRQAPGRLPNVSNVSRYEQEFNEHQETREEMDE